MERSAIRDRRSRIALRSMRATSLPPAWVARHHPIAYVVAMNEASPIAPVAPLAQNDRSLPAAHKVGVLLVNLGTPEGYDPGSVRRYLREFLSDPRVIENQGIVWKLVLNGIILPVRPRRKAHDYEKIWNKEKNEYQ